MIEIQDVKLVMFLLQVALNVLLEYVVAKLKEVPDVSFYNLIGYLVGFQ